MIDFTFLLRHLPRQPKAAHHCSLYKTLYKRVRAHEKEEDEDGGNEIAEE